MKLYTYFQAIVAWHSVREFLEFTCIVKKIPLRSNLLSCVMKISKCCEYCEGQINDSDSDLGIVKGIPLILEVPTWLARGVRKIKVAAITAITAWYVYILAY